jgi:hypothetical protein
MMNCAKKCNDAALSTDPQNEIEALERLKNSYQAGPVLGADRAVLLAVESILKNANDPPNRV